MSNEGVSLTGRWRQNTWMLRFGVGLEGNGSRLAPTGILRYLEELKGKGEASWSSGVDSSGSGKEKGIYEDKTATNEHLEGDFMRGNEIVEP